MCSQKFTRCHTYLFLKTHLEANLFETTGVFVGIVSSVKVFSVLHSDLQWHFSNPGMEMENVSDIGNIVSQHFQHSSSVEFYMSTLFLCWVMSLLDGVRSCSSCLMVSGFSPKTLLSMSSRLKQVAGIWLKIRLHGFASCTHLPFSVLQDLFSLMPCLTATYTTKSVKRLL